MIYVSDHLCQINKNGCTVCGDYTLCERTARGMLYVVSDGIGSGVYANIAAIMCAERLREHFRLGVPLRASVEMTAGSMHRARTENMPFSAFSGAMILPDGQFSVFAYEAPHPILIRNNFASVLSPRFFTANYEVVGEFIGTLGLNDILLLASDGVTQSGMGRGYSFGLGSEGVADFINKNFSDDADTKEKKVAKHCKDLSGGKYEDDTTIAILQCREPKELTLLTGPPSMRRMNPEYAKVLADAAGKKVICGSTTMDIVSEELGIPVTPLVTKNNNGMPPESSREGVDIAAEGAITLSQVCNILGEPVEQMEGNSYVKRLCILLREADIIHMHVGNAINDAHESLSFKQVGVQVRRKAVRSITEILRAMGKLVIVTNY
jgi:hypothetical protein